MRSEREVAFEREAKELAAKLSAQLTHRLELRMVRALSYDPVVEEVINIFARALVAERRMAWDLL